MFEGAALIATFVILATVAAFEIGWPDNLAAGQPAILRLRKNQFERPTEE